jgi:hypothetical protein
MRGDFFADRALPSLGAVTRTGFGQMFGQAPGSEFGANGKAQEGPKSIRR